MPTNAQLQAENDRLNQGMSDRTRVPTNLPKFTGKRGEDVREWLFQIENACRINNIPIEDASTRLPGIAGEEHTWGIFREHVLQHFEASNYHAVLREKLQRLRQTADIESYNGEYSALIFRVEGMSTLDQVLYYANGPKPRTRSYVKLENPETLIDAMGLAVKDEVTHFVDDAHERQSRVDKKRASASQTSGKDRPSKAKLSRGRGRFKPKSDAKRAESRTCHFCKKPGHIKVNCFAWKKQQGTQGNEQPRQ
ncbi:hypothetical protein PC121_g18470 [Phytophthora cactorum]|nr:hypothetical protein PC120_g18182 [Phytophthora cactorum]KAG3050279.1 hypothetical protein PC121_g18470 [Phytophthora cactorum]